MIKSTPDQNPANQAAEATQVPISPWRCAFGSLMAGAIATGCYFLTSSIAQTFSSKPIHSDNLTVLKIASAVRTLIVGVSALGTFVFALASLGLMALAVQILIRQWVKQPNPNETPQ